MHPGPTTAARSALYRRPVGLLAMLLVGLFASAAAAQPFAWSLRFSSGPSGPLGREQHAMAYDSARAVTVLFGGLRGIANGETWEWNGTVWTQRLVSGPSPRYSHAMAFDSARGVTVLFGGTNGTTRSGETWEWNGAVWTLRSVTGPTPREGHAMVYDSVRAVTVLFGGAAPALSGQTWEWNGTAWTPRAVTGPSARSAHGMAYDSDRAVSVLYGGYTGTENGETWEWNGTAWTNRTGTMTILPRYAHSMAYDRNRRRVVSYGGVISTGTVIPESDDWDGFLWNQRHPGPTPPGNRRSAAMAYDLARGVVVHYGGFHPTTGLVGQTWELCALTYYRGPFISNVHQTACATGSINLAYYIGGTGAVTLNWQWRPTAAAAWINIQSGVNTDPLGGPVQFTAQNPGTYNLTLDNFSTGTGGTRWECRLLGTNACGSVNSIPFEIYIDPADLGRQGGQPGADGLHNNNDFVVFIDQFFTQQPGADKGRQGGFLGSDGLFDNNDFVVFIDRFFTPC